MNLKTLTAVAVSAAFATSLAYAGDNKASNAKSASSGSSSAQPTFQSMDKNNDGSLSKDEVKSWSGSKDFTKLDANHDGKLSKQEFDKSSQLSSSSSSAAAGGSSAKSQK
jgi:hypothetical protein